MTTEPSSGGSGMNALLTPLSESVETKVNVLTPVIKFNNLRL